MSEHPERILLRKWVQLLVSSIAIVAVFTRSCSDNTRTREATRAENANLTTLWQCSHSEAIYEFATKNQFGVYQTVPAVASTLVRLGNTRLSN